MASQEPMTTATSASGVTTEPQPIDFGSTLEELRRMTSAEREQHDRVLSVPYRNDRHDGA